MVNAFVNDSSEASLLPDVRELPNPKSGSLLEVQFRRLLMKCAERTDISDTWQRDPKFHLYVETLQEQLSLIESNGTLRVDHALLEKYKVCVKSLVNGLLTPDVPLYCKKIPKASRAKLDAPGVTFSQSSWLPKQAQAKPDASPPDETYGSHLDPAAQNELNSQKQIQEALTDELVSMASQLKHRTKAVEKAVNQRNEILEDVDTALNYSAAAAQDAQKRAGVRFKKSKMGTCMLCLALLAVGCVFTGMVVFMKFTSIMGYKSSQAGTKSIPTDHEEPRGL